MARYPTPGQVKTRLSRAIGAAPAAALYGAFLRDLAANLGVGPWQLVWAVAPPAVDLAGLVGDAARYLAQRGDGLSERMWCCFEDVFGSGASRVVMLGADVPHIAAADVDAALAALEAVDVALMPARDGGYGLIGLRAPHDLFTGVAMSTPAVCAATLARARALGLTVRVLAETFDVDEWEDLLALRSLIESGAVRLPHTAPVLESVFRHHP
jgi:rSAM/selenodomain-associated transferase 1